jgi:polyisoprenoid-binding protein YceI
MKLQILVFGLALAYVVAPLSAAETFKVVPDKSKVDFIGKKTDGQHKGGFKKITGEAQIDHATPDKSSIKLEIETESIWSDDNKLTEHLKNPDFFNVRKFPKITFESTKIEHGAEGEAVITGKMTMLEKTVETKVPVKVSKSDDGLKMLATFKIDRTKWGMVYGEGKINKEVELTADLLLKK